MHLNDKIRKGLVMQSNLRNVHCSFYTQWDSHIIKVSFFIHNFIICRKRNYKTKIPLEHLHQSSKMSQSNHYSDSTSFILPKLNSIVFNLEALNKYVQLVKINPNQDILIQNTIDRVETMMANIVNNLNRINNEDLKTEASKDSFTFSDIVKNNTTKEEGKIPKEKITDVKLIKKNKKKNEGWEVVTNKRISPKNGSISSSESNCSSSTTEESPKLEKVRSLPKLKSDKMYEGTLWKVEDRKQSGNRVGMIKCPNLKNDFDNLKKIYPFLTLNSSAFKRDIIFKEREFANIDNGHKKQTVTFNIVYNAFTKNFEAFNVKSKY